MILISTINFCLRPPIKQKMAEKTLQSKLDLFLPGTHINDVFDRGSSSFLYEVKGTHRPRNGVFVPANGEAITLTHKDATYDLLRIHFFYVESRKEFTNYVKNLETAMTRGYKSNVTPISEIIDKEMQGNLGVVVSLIEKVKDIIPVGNWATAFNGNKHKMLELFFTTGRRLEQADIIHPDISAGNIILARYQKDKTKLRMFIIDLDAACLPKTKQTKEFCTNVHVFTPAYRPIRARTDTFYREVPYAKRKVMMWGLLALAAYSIEGHPFEMAEKADEMGVEQYIRSVFREQKYKTFVDGVLNMTYTNFSQALKDFPECTISCKSEPRRKTGVDARGPAPQPKAKLVAAAAARGPAPQPKAKLAAVAAAKGPAPQPKAAPKTVQQIAAAAGAAAAAAVQATMFNKPKRATAVKKHKTL